MQKDGGIYKPDSTVQNYETSIAIMCFSAANKDGRYNKLIKNAENYVKNIQWGGDGTLEKRFRDSDLRGRVFGKSGYVNGVSSLSGYVKAKDGQWYAFSILMNGVSDIATCKQIQERIVKAIDADSNVASAKD